MRIELCGGIASGKSTLVSSITDLTSNYSRVIEDFSGTGHLEDFYSNPVYYAFDTEISCLLHHVHQIKVSMLKSDLLICDFSLEQDWVYARNILSPREWYSFDLVYQEAVQQINQADLIISLTCSVDEMLKRVSARGRKSEAAVDTAYLNKIIFGLKERLPQTGIDTLELNSEQNDFRVYENVSKLILGPLSHFF